MLMFERLFGQLVGTDCLMGWVIIMVRVVMISLMLIVCRFLSILLISY